MKRARRATPLFRSSEHAPSVEATPCRQLAGGFADFKTAFSVIKRRRNSCLDEAIPTSPTSPTLFPASSTVTAHQQKKPSSSPEISAPHQNFRSPQALSSPLTRGHPTSAPSDFNTCKGTTVRSDSEDDLLLGLCPEDLSFNLSTLGDGGSGPGGLKLSGTSVEGVKQDTTDGDENVTDTKSSEFSGPRSNTGTVSISDPIDFASPRARSNIPFLYPSPTPKCNVPWKQSMPKIANTITTSTLTAVKNEAKWTPGLNTNENVSTATVCCNERKDNQTSKTHHFSPPLPSIPLPPSTGPGSNGLHCYPAGTFYGLPQSVSACFREHRGITNLYDWQDTCLRLPCVARGDNLIYSLPTSGGKTLVAEVVILQQLLLAHRDVLFILPFVSIVQEKVRDLAPFAAELGFAVEEYAGSRGGIPPRKRRRKNVVYMATIEKANGLVNSLIEHERIASIGLAVIDELHMLGDGGPRGGTLEVCLAKLAHCPAPSPQLVGLSATLSNISELASFLRAEVYQSDFRPVELVEHVKVGRCVYTVRVCEGGEGGVELIPSRVIKDSADPFLDLDQLVTLVAEVVPESSCLVFCATKKLCQNVALLLAKALPSSLKSVHSSERQTLLSDLSLEAAGVCPVLSRTIPLGVGYHHSGLTTNERRLLEEGYLRGTLCVLACTSTLAAGVNLPAKRVILRSPYIGSKLLTHSQYRQMIGRAGRSGLCETGESFLITQPQDRNKVLSLLSSPYDHCSSSLLSDGWSTLLSLILTLIGLKIVKSSSELAHFLQSTLLYVQQETDYILSCCHDAVAKLVAMGYITMETHDGTAAYLITTLGRATYKGCLPVGLAHVIHGDLVQGQRCLALSSDLHLLFLATPPELATTIQPNWMAYFQTLTQLGEGELRVAEMVGVRPATLAKRATGAATRMSNEEVWLYHRFYLALMLHSLLLRASGVEGMWSISSHFQCSRGFLQSVVTSTSAFASCLTHFTQELPELWALHLLFPAVSKKLALSASTLDLVPLLEIPGVKQGRARHLLKAGYRTPNDVAVADHMTLVEEIDHLFPTQAKKIITAAKALLSERAEALIEEAEELMSLAPPSEL